MGLKQLGVTGDKTRVRSRKWAALTVRPPVLLPVSAMCFGFFKFAAVRGRHARTDDATEHGLLL